MPKRSESKLGFDPLSWMDEDSGEQQESNKTATEKQSGKEKTMARSSAAKKGSAKSVTNDHPLGLNVPALEKSFNLLAPQADQLVARFYEELFKRHPDVKPLFKNTTPDKQQKKLLAALKLVVENLNNVDVLAKTLTALGERHEHYGAIEAHYAAVATTLMDVMKEMAGRAWTKEVQEAWSHALGTIAEVMLNAYGKSEGNTMAASLEDVSGMTEAESAELTRMRSAVDGAMTAIMMIDRDFNITYANKSTIDMLTRHQDTLRSVFPGFNVDNLIGSCIDTFHRNPSHQRQLLSNPANLPYSTDIEVGPLNFRLNVTAMIDDDGNYIGNTLEWADITEAKQKESEVVRLQGTVDGAMTAIMMIDRDLNVTYANEATLKILRGNADALRSLFPGFDPEKLIGSCIDMFHKNPSHQRQLLSNPANLPYSTDIHVGPLTFRINVTAIMDAQGEYVGNALEWSDVTEERRKEKEVARLMSAVDGAEANLMLCDEDLNITYANPAVVSMLANRQTELRKIWPSLDVNNLIGTCIDGFHKNPAHQRALLADKSRLPATAEIKVGDLEFRVNATMITGPNGEYMGNMVQWGDITEQKDAERQIENLIDAATMGELNTRINADEYEGFMKNLGTGINNLMNAVVAPIQESKRVMVSLSEGDLTQKMDGEFHGEFAELRDAVNESIKNLFNMVNDIRDASGSISSAASEISQGNTDLSQRTEEQASSLEETASSMEEMTSTVKQNADNARQANQLASAAREQAEKGGEVVSNAVTAMGEINASSKKISDIISVIDEIAFQTNLLALNAAVEAARAGEQGRGFAVVAGEVRNLAQRSAGAAKEIKSLINDSVEKVDEGSKLVDESGETLSEIVNAVKKVSDIIAEIAAAGQEQSSGIEQVNKAVMQMDEMTQQNAALVEEAASASESMEEQAKGMMRLMEFFNLGDAGQVKQEPVSPSRNLGHSSVKPAAQRTRPAAPKQQATDADDSEWDEF
ncbi:MAG: methyl-accepting chemotaxis protein [Thioalkalispiraceae bacterium]|jgi:methyl-accepting chemotaxis protein